jgi:hypothetical protein
LMFPPKLSSHTHTPGAGPHPEVSAATGLVRLRSSSARSPHVSSLRGAAALAARRGVLGELVVLSAASSSSVRSSTLARPHVPLPRGSRGGCASRGLAANGADVACALCGRRRSAFAAAAAATEEDSMDCRASVTARTRCSMSSRVVWCCAPLQPRTPPPAAAVYDVYDGDANSDSALDAELARAPPG